MSRTHQLRWFPDAYDDLRAARDWYEEQSDGLGAEFITEFWRTLDAVDRSPTVLRLVELDGSDEKVRRWHFDASWPYSIVYLVEDEMLIIVAVLHDRRHPRHWANRVQ